MWSRWTSVLVVDAVGVDGLMGVDNGLMGVDTDSLILLCHVKTSASKL